MGSQESKLEEPSNQEDEMKETALNDSVPSSPILTPVDPRSPSVNIARTPLELILGSKTAEDEAEVIEDGSGDTKDLVNVILGIDPRSPTVEFNRTPIIVGAVTKEKPSRLQNKNLNNVRKSEIQTTPITTIQKPSKIVPPKLLSISPVSVISNYNKRKSFVGLLETNIDFTETNLDSVCHAKDIQNHSLPVEIKEDLPSNKLKSQMAALNIAASECTLQPEELQVSDDLQTEEKDVESISDEKIAEEKTINVTAHVKDFDRKLTNLIYQDDSDDNKLCSRLIKSKENNRTPLSVRNSNEEPKKASSRLKVSDKPRKSENSKIPVLKDHGRKVGIQCENTPPSKWGDTKGKSKVSHWDADKTLII